MFRTFVLLAAVACALGSAIQPRALLPDGRIVGGEDTTIEEYPYQVSVQNNGVHICGGSIISSKVVVTAAHCISDSIDFYSVAYGETELKNAIFTNEPVIDSLRHESYNKTTMDYDVGLLFLFYPIQNTATSKPISLATETPASGTIAVVTGWGTTSEGGSAATILQKVSVPIVDHLSCLLVYGDIKLLTTRMLCAGDSAGGKDSCQGDSGGPLVVNGELVGIVSWGYGCARAGYPGVYTDVASVQTWIEKHM